MNYVYMMTSTTTQCEPQQQPVLIESNDSKLVERLQINEFLYSAQQARNPVPMIIEKVLSSILF